MENTFNNRINTYRSALSKGDLQVADYLANHLKEASRINIQELADKTTVSVATISRFVKKIGFDNFQDLKLFLSQSNNQSTDFFASLADSDSNQVIAEKTFQANIRSIQATGQMLREDQLNKAIDLLMASHTCGFFGMGGSAAVALNAYHKFLRMPLHTFFSNDYHIQLMEAAKMTPMDCALIVSHTGKNKDTLAVLEVLKKRKVPIITITSFVGSPIAEASDVSFISVSEETFYRPEAIASVVSQLSIIDSLFMIYGTKMKHQAEKTIGDIREVIHETRLE